MAKTIKEQIAEALAPVKKQLDEAEARAERLSDEGCDVWAILEGNDEGTLPKLAGKRMSEIKAMEQRIAKLEAEAQDHKGTLETVGELEAEAERLREELAEARRIIAQQAGEVSAARRELGDGIDLSAAIYRDALADFAIRVLSGGVEISFRGPTA